MACPLLFKVRILVIGLALAALGGCFDIEYSLRVWREKFIVHKTPQVSDGKRFEVSVARHVLRDECADRMECLETWIGNELVKRGVCESRPTRMEFIHNRGEVYAYGTCGAGSEATKHHNDLITMKAQELKASHRAELEKLGGIDCNTGGSGRSAETLFRRGKFLLATHDYKSAMTCFMQAQELEQGSFVYQESCSAIGSMYELGWGVEKDIPTAMSWYHKAGL